MSAQTVLSALRQGFVKLAPEHQEWWRGTVRIARVHYTINLAPEYLHNQMALARNQHIQELVQVKCLQSTHVMFSPAIFLCTATSVVRVRGVSYN